VALALVTGANCGIGLEVARELRRDGMRMEALDITPLELDVADLEGTEAVPVAWRR
jgi:NAD(P)-dependent dehydrogenase (short-subunit alcohol dehydrogenase family)